MAHFGLKRLYSDHSTQTMERDGDKKKIFIHFSNLFAIRTGMRECSSWKNFDATNRPITAAPPDFDPPDVLWIVRRHRNN